MGFVSCEGEKLSSSLEAPRTVLYILVSMLIRIASFVEGENPVEEELSAGDLDLDAAVYAHPIQVTGTVENLGHMLNVDVTVTTEAEAVCDRCAIEFQRPCEVDVQAHVLFREARDQEEEETEGLIFAGRKPSEVDLSNEIREALLLEWPMLVYCREDCKGLCRRCGADLNEGPCTCEN